MRLFIYGSTVVGAHDEIAAVRILDDPNMVRELTEDEITEAFGDYPQWAGPQNTTVDEDGNITFTFDEDGHLDALKAHVKEQRDVLLSSSDWRYLKGNEFYQTTDWASYRQALRDVTTQAGYPTDVKWPTTPS